MKKSLLYTFVGVLALAGCKEEKKKVVEQSMEMTRKKIAKNFVDTLVLKKTNFSKQINCNGKLRAIAKSELVLASPGVLRKIEVGNGSFVRKGELIAMVDREKAEIELAKALRNMEKSRIDLLDKLIGEGYEDTTRVPKPILQRAKISSGYLTSMDHLETAERALEECHLYAPFSGRVANVNAKLHQRADKFCTLIDDSYFDVEFNILEAEMGVGAVGQKVVVSPFINAQKRYEGVVTQVNPLVDDKGQIKLRAKIKNINGELLEGMNVKVVVENDVPDMFVVPKDAVVLRDGFHVVFRYEDNSAVWTYVDVMHSNLESYAITGNRVKKTKVNDGDIIITSGNLNLADGTAVEAKAPKKKK